MTSSVASIVALVATSLGQPQPVPAAPPAPEVGVAVPSYPQPPHGPPVPAPGPPAVYAAPTPPVPFGAYWYGAMVPVAHQRVLYYPGWDYPVRTLLGKPPKGAPALDVWQSVVPVYWERVGQ